MTARKAAKVRRRTFSVGNRSGGFSLLEVLAVTVLLSLAAAGTYPSFSNFSERVAFDTTARQIASALRTARSEAISRHTDTTVTFDLDARTFAYPESFGPRQIPSFVEVTVYTARQEQVASRAAGVRFFGGGGSTGGQIRLTHRASIHVIDINWLTGQIRVLAGDA